MALTIVDKELESIQLSAEIREKALYKAKEGYVMALLEVGEITSGRAAKILDISRIEVIEMMNKWGISLFDDSQSLEELHQEVEQAALILNQQIS
jgi:predicted HTH domain antitoxin